MQATILRNDRGRKYLTQKERVAFFKGALRLEPYSASFCLTLLFTGCRISEAIHLKPEQLDPGESVVVIETLKQRKSGIFRAVPVPYQLLEFIPAWNPGERIWSFSRTTAYRLVRLVMEDISLHGPQACPKGLRHGFGVACVEKEIPLNKISKWMGHAKIESTGIYLNVVGEEERRLADRLWRDFNLDPLFNHANLKIETK